MTMHAVIRQLHNVVLLFVAYFLLYPVNAALSFDAKSLYNNVIVSMVYIYDVGFTVNPSGTGFVVGDGTLIVAHDRAASESSILKTSSGREIFGISLLKYDQHHNISLLKSPIKLDPLEFSPCKPKIGQNIASICMPLGDENLKFSLMTGVVSGIRQFNGRTYIQHTVPMSVGSAGGPILDENGRVLGMNYGAYWNKQGLGFAVPASVLTALVDSYLPRKKAVKGTP